MQIFYNSATEPAPVLINGNPPVDQSALVTQLTSDLATANGTITTLQGKIAAALTAAQADKAADAANVAGQGVLDALS